MKTGDLLYTIGEKVSYKKLSYGIRFYIRSASRSDTLLLQQMQRKSLWTLGAAILFSIPLLFIHLPYLRWPWFITSLLIWLYWAAHHQTYLLKRYGIETISIYKGRISYRRYLRHPLCSLQVKSYRCPAPVDVTTDNSTPVRPNAVITGSKVITSYIRFVRSSKSSRMLVHPLLKEQDEFKKIMEEYF